MRWNVLAKHLGSQDMDIRVATAIMVLQLFTNKEGKDKFQSQVRQKGDIGRGRDLTHYNGLQAYASGILELVIKMAASLDPAEQLASARVLAVVATNQEVKKGPVCVSMLC